MRGLKEAPVRQEQAQTLQTPSESLPAFPRDRALGPTAALSPSVMETIEFLKLFFIRITIPCSPDSLAVMTNKGSGPVITI